MLPEEEPVSMNEIVPVKFPVSGPSSRKGTVICCGLSLMSNDDIVNWIGSAVPGSTFNDELATAIKALSVARY